MIQPWISGAPARHLKIGDNPIAKEDPGFVDAANGEIGLREGPYRKSDIDRRPAIKR